MATLTIGQQGKLGETTLTIVSFNDKTFTCDNGKMYITASARWMTDGIVTKESKPKRAKKFYPVPDDYLEEMNKKSNISEFEEMMEQHRRNQLPSSMRRF